MNKILWNPNLDSKNNLEEFKNLINSKYALSLDSYQELYEWSVKNIPDFWNNVITYSDIQYSGDTTTVLEDLTMKPTANWFPNTSLNFAENLLNERSDHLAIISKSEKSDIIKITYNELYLKVAKLANSLKRLGIKPGDRIAAILPNSHEAVIAMLATTSIGAIWSSCSPDFGINSVTDRFKQIEPKIIFSIHSYYYNGKLFDFRKKLNSIIQNLSSLEKIIISKPVEEELNKNEDVLNLLDLFDNNCDEIQFEKFPFNHPAFILYTSGTTGLPKSIVHGAGGTLLQHKKELLLHCNASKDDIVFYYTTCGWMMWNWQVSFLSTGSTIVLYDGSPFFPDKTAMWNFIDELDITIFGTSAKFIDACKSHDLSPNSFAKLDSLKQILSTGSPLVPESFDYVYEKVKKDIRLGSISGGTDIISCFALNSPSIPVYRGELQCRGLGMDVDAFDDNGNSVENVKGELVCKSPFPSMPISFWNDEKGEKYYNAYFNKFKNVWAHGDFIEINEHGGVVIYGRSDATLNPGGVRIGTAEIYRIVEKFIEVEDSLVVGQEWKNDQRVILFLKLKEGYKLLNTLTDIIKKNIKSSLSPRHVPAIILQIKDIPYTISGKKVELAVKKIIERKNVVNQDALSNPESLELYKSIPELL
ncbi:acetoacetate--CoA ligase [bacterium]|jgi:acetoacetyl-CoA synthetase|nr:acetoacetate--CoA ligase [bacterium]MBT5735009.1 acetoacetate--CoA ligase [bacterium]MBT6018740.1 acetoacetate--CoA ligase [bacterium]MBT6777720.1 acetoacetate--CoA ligase [bacterium]